MYMTSVSPVREVITKTDCLSVQGCRAHEPDLLGVYGIQAGIKESPA